MRKNDPNNFCEWSESLPHEAAARVAACGAEPSAVLVYTSPSQSKRVAWPRARESQERIIKSLVDGAASITRDKPLRLEWRASVKNRVVCRVWTIAAPAPDILTRSVSDSKQKRVNMNDDDDGAEQVPPPPTQKVKTQNVLNQNGRNEYDLEIARIQQQTALIIASNEANAKNAAALVATLRTKDEQLTKREDRLYSFMSQAVAHEISFLGVMKDYALGMAATNGQLGEARARLESQAQVNELLSELRELKRDGVTKMADQLAPMIPAVIAKWAGVDGAALMAASDDAITREIERRAAIAEAAAREAEREQAEKARAAGAAPAPEGEPKPG